MVFKYNKKDVNSLGFQEVYAPELDGQELDILIRVSVIRNTTEWTDGLFSEETFFVSIFIELGDEYGNKTQLLKFPLDSERVFKSYEHLLMDFVTDELALTIRDCRLNEVLDKKPKFVPLMKKNNRLF